MAGPVEGGGPEGTDYRDPIRLDFELEDTYVQDLGITKGNEVMDEELGKPFKEARRTPLTRQITEFVCPEYKMPANIKLYNGTTDPEDHLSHFANATNSGEWPMPVWCRMSINFGRVSTRMVRTASSRQHKQMGGLKRGIRCQVLRQKGMFQGTP
nr:reverse transcriptase domain-containing protein [Tanacetum cinerariifolium]